MTTLVDVKAPQLAPVGTRGENVVVWGSAGSGKSMLAINLSCELSDLGQSVMLVDADSYHPSQAAIAGLTAPGPGITAMLRLERSGRLDGAEIDRLSRELNFGSGMVCLVPGMNNPGRWAELEPGSLMELAGKLAASHDFVVWDVASQLDPAVQGGPLEQQRNQASLTLLTVAEQVLGTFTADPLGINRFLFDVRLAGRPFTAVANRVRPAALGRNPERQIRDTLFELAKIEVEHLIPEDSGFDEQLRTTAPLLAQGRKSKARERIRQLAQELITSRSG